MKKRIKAIFLFVLCTLQGFSVGIIEFSQKPFNMVKEQAAAENKIIFIDFYASWCGPCKKMEKEVFTNDSVANFYNSTFINLKLDIEKGDGEILAKKYNITSVPSLYFISATENVIHKHQGALNHQAFIQLGHQALDPENRIDFYKINYEKNPSDYESLVQYIDVLKRENINTKNIVASYLKNLSENDLFEEKNLNLILNHYNHDSTYYTSFIEKHKDLISKSVSGEKINDYLFKIYYKKANQVLKQKKKDFISYFNYYEKLKVYNKDSTYHRNLTLLDLTYLKVTKNDEAYIEKCKYYFNSFDVSSNELAYAAMYFNENFYKNPQVLAQASIWAKESVRRNENKLNTYILASILFKEGNYEEAKVAIQKSIELRGANDKICNSLAKKIDKKIKSRK